MRQRNVGLCILFSIITCGIYGIYWFIVMTDDANSIVSDDGYVTSGGMAFLLTLVTCGIYSIYWSFKMGQKMNRLRPQDGGYHVIFLLLSIFGFSIINYCLLQSEINKHAAY